MNYDDCMHEILWALRTWAYRTRGDSLTLAGIQDWIEEGLGGVYCLTRLSRGLDVLVRCGQVRINLDGTFSRVRSDPFDVESFSEEVPMTSFGQVIPVREMATLLLLMHGQLFSEKRLLELTELCHLRFKGKDDHARALWEWLCFGLYAVVEGIQNNHRSKDQLGMAIAHGLFSQFYSGLKEAGATDTEVRTKEEEFRHRFDQYNEVVANGEVERLGFAAAAFVLKIEIKPGSFPKVIEAFEFGIAANQAYIAALKAANELFSSHRVSL